MSATTADIIILGATGFTGRQIAKYLSHHPQRSQFTFAIAGRTTKKLQAMTERLKLTDVPALEFDVDSSEVEEIVENFKVVINTVGPYCRWGTRVVMACARAGTHYVDLSGELPWIKHIINELNDLPSRSSSLIVPACGFDSLPSDLGVFVSVNALSSAYGSDILVGSSVTAHDFQPGVKRGMSKGSLLTGLAMMEDIPRKDLLASTAPYYLSPGTPPPPIRLYYALHLPQETIYGSFFPLGPANAAIVERTWGLLQVRKEQSGEMSYGPSFNYSEFLKVSSSWLAVPKSLFSMLLVFSLMFIAPMRWVLKYIFSGDDDDEPGEGHSTSTNLTACTLSGDSTSHKYAKSTFTIKVDPGYIGTSVMISECALGLLLTPRAQLPQGGEVLTPVTALGVVLVERLNSTGVVEVRSEVVSEIAKGGSRKRD